MPILNSRAGDWDTTRIWRQISAWPRTTSHYGSVSSLQQARLGNSYSCPDVGHSPVLVPCNCKIAAFVTLSRYTRKDITRKRDLRNGTFVTLNRKYFTLRSNGQIRLFDFLTLSFIDWMDFISSYTRGKSFHMNIVEKHVMTGLEQEWNNKFVALK